jgi:hypothetical protein
MEHGTWRMEIGRKEEGDQIKKRAAEKTLS